MYSAHKNIYRIFTTVLSFSLESITYLGGLGGRGGDDDDMSPKAI